MLFEIESTFDIKTSQAHPKKFIFYYFDITYELNPIFYQLIDLSRLNLGSRCLQSRIINHPIEY